MKKSNKKGFTLVELVVVIAIIGILAAILVPTMMNYVKKAKLKSANTSAKLVFTTVNGEIADIVTDGTNIADIQSVGATKVSDLSSVSNKLGKAVYNALKDNGNGAGYVCWAVAANEVKAAQWSASNSQGDIVGQYPNPINTPDDYDNLTSPQIGNILGTAFGSNAPTFSGTLS